MKNIGLIGGGAMGEAILAGLVRKGVEPETLLVSDISRERLECLKNKLGVKTTVDNKEVVRYSEVIILAVKPQNIMDALKTFASVLTPDKLLISIAAGISTSFLEEAVPLGCKVIRVMPNTPALINAGTTVLAGGKFVTQEDLAVAEEIFKAVGSVTILPEKMLNAVTGLSGSGPAYVYVLIEALADGGVLAGLPRDVALKLAAETVQGAARMVQETKLHPGHLKDMVTSPGGTAITGLLQMEKAGIRGIIMETVLAATRRSQELLRK